MRMFTAALFTAEENWEQPKGPLIGTALKELLSINIGVEVGKNRADFNKLMGHICKVYCE